MSKKSQKKTDIELPIGKRLSPILKNIEAAIWASEAQNKGQPKFTDEGFRAAVKIFAACLLDQLWNKQEKDKIPIDYRGPKAVLLGEDVRKLILEYTGIDTKEFYESDFNGVN